MNRLILLVILLFSVQAFSQEKIIVKRGDTVIAKGDHIFTIEDWNQPSKPLLKKKIAPIEKSAPPLIVNNYFPEQPVYNPTPIQYRNNREFIYNNSDIDTNPGVINHYYHDNDSDSASIFDMFAISLMIVSIGLLLYHYGVVNKSQCTVHNCEHKKEPATINTFHINGGDANALIDKSVKSKSSCSHDLHQIYPNGGEEFMSSIAPEYGDREEKDKQAAIFTEKVMERVNKDNQTGQQEYVYDAVDK